MDGADDRQTLAHYPWPMVRIACRYCERRGRYRLERLIDLFGRDASFEDVLIRVSADCTRATDRMSRPGGCRGAYLLDIEQSRRSGRR